MTKRTRGILLVCLVSTALFATLCSFKPVKAVASAELLPDHHGFYIPPPVGVNGVFSVVGEVRNNGTEPLNINVTVSFLDRQGIPFTTSIAHTFIEYVRPGEKAPFRLALSDQNAPNVISYTAPEITWALPSSAKPLSLQVLNSTFYGAKDGLVKSPGTVKNNGGSFATKAAAIITYYNKTNGKILWASKTIVENQNLSSGETSRFELSSTPLNVTRLPLDKCSFAVVVESPEYISPTFTNTFRDTFIPQIGTLVWSPATPTPTQIVTVNVTISKPDYMSKVTNASVYYKVGGDKFFTKINMTASGNLWRSPNIPKIGPFGAGQTVQFYIEALDDAGNKATTKSYSFTVQGQPSGVPIEYVLITVIVLILLIVIYRYRKRIF